MINSYFAVSERCGLLVQLLDSRHAPSADDRMMLEYLHHHQIPFVVALTKADKLKKAQATAAVTEFSEICAPYGCKAVILTSAQTGAGVEELKAFFETVTTD